MNDPLEALRAPVEPVHPDPGFAAALRARVERALLAPGGDPVMTTPTQLARLHSLNAYLCVDDAERAVDFYVAVFGATRRDDPILMPDGKVGHVEVAIGDSILMLAEEFPELGLLAPVTRGGSSLSLLVHLADPDTAVAAAEAGGGRVEQPVADTPHGRRGVVLDPAGHRWMVVRDDR